MSLKSLPKVFVRVTPITPALPSQTSEGTQNIVTPFTGPATALLKYMCKRLSSINCLKLRIMHCFREANSQDRDSTLGLEYSPKTIDEVRKALFAQGSSDLGPQKQFWKGVWNLRVPNKIKHFAWHACNNALPTMVNLHRRHIIPNDTCEICKE
nr:putative ribonuclease h protein [Quercus suber]